MNTKLSLLALMALFLFGTQAYAQSRTVGVVLKTPQDRLYKTFLREAIKKPANFAGHYVLDGPGCGTECEMYAAIDKNSGSVIWLPFMIQEWVAIAEAANEGRPIRFSLNSNRVVVLGHLVFNDHRNETGRQTWQLIGGRFVLLKVSPVPKLPPPEIAASGNLVTLTGSCRLQLNGSRFFPCQPKVVFLSKTGYSHLAFVTKDKTSEIVYSLSGQSDRQPNLENYYLKIDTLSMDGIGEYSGSFRGMEGECHFRMNKSATNFYFVKCEIYNPSKGTTYNFYLENITKSDRKIY